MDLNRSHVPGLRAALTQADTTTTDSITVGELERMIHEALEPPGGTSCQARQTSDQMTCSCGNVWDMNDPEPPVCRVALVAYDLSPADREGAIRDRLIAMGWTPPDQPAPAVRGEPVGYFLNTNRFKKEAPHWEQVADELKSNEDMVPLYAEQHPAPDVAGLVGALEEIASYPEDDAGEMRRIARAALAVHRSRGGAQ